MLVKLLNIGEFFVFLLLRNASFGLSEAMTAVKSRNGGLTEFYFFFIFVLDKFDLCLHVWLEFWNFCLKLLQRKLFQSLRFIVFAIVVYLSVELFFERVGFLFVVVGFEVG